MTPRISDIMQQRVQKLERLRQRGVTPYPNSYHRSHTTAQAVTLLEELEKNGQPGQDGESAVNVAGRVTANRDMGKISFMDIRDSTGRIQLLFNKKNLDEASTLLLNDMDIGDFIGATGTVFRTRTGEPTVDVKGLSLLSKSMQPLPEKWHGLSDQEMRYRQRYLDLIANPEVMGVFKTRSRVLAAIRQFLNGRGFLEVETPVLQPSAGGALARPFITHHHALDQDFYLRIALELHLKRLIVGGMDRVFELGRVFRNEGISVRHNPEFTMLESYEAYADYKDVMEMLEQMVAFACREVADTTVVQWGEHNIDFTPPWQRLSLREAVREYSGIDFASYPSADGLRERMRPKMKELGIEVEAGKNWDKLVDDLISTFVEPKLIQPTILYDYPLSMSPLAKTKPGEERVVERFEAFCGSLEIANAFSELNDPHEQRERFEHQLGERHEKDEEKWTIDEDYLTALEYGMPPTGGLGVGIDRLVMLLTNQHSIREVILFPQMREKHED